MKPIKLAFSTLFFAVLILAAGSFTTASAQPMVSVNFNSFYGNLSPYGTWLSNPQYGSVWRPNVGPDFHPYLTNGRWVMTDYGNTWVSDYSWGWAPFHYGRWYFDDYDGWIWVPGYEWGPAWVNWRSGGDYYGWAPLGPGININVNINIPLRWWTFVPRIHIASPRLFGFCVPFPRLGGIYNRTTVINNYYHYDNRVYASGPRYEEVRHYTRQDVPVYRYGREDNREILRRSGPGDSPRGTFSDNTRSARVENPASYNNGRFSDNNRTNDPNNSRSRGDYNSPRDYGTNSRNGSVNDQGSYGVRRGESPNNEYNPGSRDADRSNPSGNTEYRRPEANPSADRSPSNNNSRGGGPGSRQSGSGYEGNNNPSREYRTPGNAPRQQQEQPRPGGFDNGRSSRQPAGGGYQPPQSSGSPRGGREMNNGGNSPSRQQAPSGNNSRSSSSRGEGGSNPGPRGRN